ncbi:hypothetical protein SFRURICE_013729 [Spodoptera frugiperda]|uniref:unspecific monooxygenase n=1 Tax=Spodoptera frugiperda TaxID=7108 RepID=A0A2H1X2A1_SPOFR|nr:hypothetical protein SFRURICE_013729 [Spodoptera frugiperda]
MFLPVILLGLVVLLLFVYLYKTGKYNENYWKKRGVKFYDRSKAIGPYWEFLTTKRALFEILGDIYKEYKDEPAVGIGQLSTPALFVIHPKNVQQVLQTDFQAFHHRGMESVEGDQLSDNILFMNGPRWKLMRKSMSPLFTASKLKNMYYIMDKSAQDFVSYLKENPKKRESDIYATVTAFCNAAICGAVFGIGSESTFDSPFIILAENMSATKLKNVLRFAIVGMSPKIANMLGIKLFKEHEDYFISSIAEVIRKREAENVKRHDFADLCISLQKNGTLKDDTTGCTIEPTTGLLSAQALFFFAAGVEPCAVVIFSTLTLLSCHPEILEKVHKEIDEKFEKYNGQITYDVINEMEYVDKVLNEATRILPPNGYVTRQCVQDTVLEVGNIKVVKGTKIFTPIYQIHHDPRFYPEPEVFDPERFSKDRKPTDDIFMPFGMGNRMCLGARYAKLQVLAGLVHALRHFTVESNADMRNLIFQKHILNVKPDNVNIKLIPRDIK